MESIIDMTTIEFRAYKSLWGEVLLRAICDALGIDIRKTEAKNISYDGLRFFTERHNRRDLYMICDLIGIDPNAVIDFVKKSHIKSIEERKLIFKRISYMNRGACFSHLKINEKENYAD